MLSSVVALSCDKRTDYFESINEEVQSVLTLGNSHSSVSGTINDKTIIDTLKQGNDYSFSLNLIDESEFNLSFEGDGDLEMNNIPFNSGNLVSGSYDFLWKIDTVGVYNFSIKIIDNYSVETVYSFTINVFYNKTPQIWWELIDDGSLGDLHKKLVVHGADQDELFGGGIIYYQYVIGVDTTNHPYSEMNYIFPSDGLYDIGIKAMDNNYEWSNEVFIHNYPVN